MDTSSSGFEYITFESADALDEADKGLFNAAIKATENSSAPYSGLRVGAAMLFDDGTAVTGSNFENGAYPVGVCAERAAIYNALNDPGRRGQKVQALAVAAIQEGSSNLTEISPCGECRQVLYEFALTTGSKLQILLPGPGGTILKILDVADLLPLPFNGPRSQQKRAL
jgi:cytidine deaminase